MLDEVEKKQRWCKFGYKTEREIQKYKDVLLMRKHGWRVSLLFCNNCDFAMIAHKVYDCENLHWVCPVCFMPSENKNPLKKDLDNV